MIARSTVAFVVLLVACSGGTSTNPPGGGSSGGGSSGGSSGGGSSGGSSSGGGAGTCPTSAPTAGATCSPLGLWCEYGGDPDLACNTVSVCNTGSTWTTTASTTSSQCPTGQPGAGQCPSSYGAVPVGKTCTPNGTECGYAQGRCACTVQLGGPAMPGGGSATWVCEQPAAGCPEPRPQAGTACTSSLMCDYGSCALPGGTTMQCTNGTWGVSITACAD